MRIALYISILLIGAACSSDKEDTYVPINTDTNNNNPKLEFKIPSNFPAPTYEVTQNPPTEKGFELGKKLFYDGRLSSDGVVSCGFCHMPEFAFTHHSHIVSHGIDSILGTRNAQPLQNMAFMKEFTWDGAVNHLDLQPIVPITSPVEMNETVGNVIQKLEGIPEYVTLFSEAFDNQEVSPDNMLKALSQFMVLMVSSNSKYDRIERNEGSVFTTDEAQGFELFKAKCASCHSGTLFTDQSYRNNGLPVDPQYNDIGRNRVTALEEDLYKFKVPSLRNIELTYPYMHDGRLKTLNDVLDHYSDGIVDSKTLDPLLKDSEDRLGIPITENEKAQIILFLKTLTDDNFVNDDRFAEF